jgi:ubiquinone/menaquinone biosynthesis C-methylase UbiE
MILDAQLYLQRRKKNLLTKYRLRRRIEKVVEMVQKYKNGKDDLKVLDIGAADGTMLYILKQKFDLSSAVGIEPNEGLISAKVSNDIELVHGCGENLPFKDSSFDIVIISATIEHVKDPQLVIKETYRVLSKNGLVIIITVVPWLDKLAEKFHIFPKSLHRHFHRFNLKQLRDLLNHNRFKILELNKFALPSSGLIPFDSEIEKILNRIGINFIMTYELAVGMKL